MTQQRFVTHLTLIKCEYVWEYHLHQAAHISTVIHNNCSPSGTRQDHCPVGIIYTELNHNKPNPTTWPHFGCGNYGIWSEYTSHDLSLDRSSSSIPHVGDDFICGEKGFCQTNVLCFVSSCSEASLRVVTHRTTQSWWTIGWPRVTLAAGESQWTNDKLSEVIWGSVCLPMYCVYKLFLFHWTKHFVSPTNETALLSDMTESESIGPCPSDIIPQRVYLLV